VYLSKRFYTAVIKTYQSILVHNFDKCWPIFKILLLSDSTVNCSKLSPKMKELLKSANDSQYYERISSGTFLADGVDAVACSSSIAWPKLVLSLLIILMPASGRSGQRRQHVLELFVRLPSVGSFVLYQSCERDVLLKMNQCPWKLA